MVVSNRQTDRQTDAHGASVTIGTAMRNVRWLLAVKPASAILSEMLY